MDTPKAPSKAIIGIIVVVLLAVATTGFIVVGDSSNKTSASSNPPSTFATAPNTNGSSSSSASKNFKDGSYTAVGKYDSPGGPQTVGVKVTLASGVITDASVTQDATDGEAVQYQSRFASGFKAVVVGKKVADVSLTRVAGSSLTPIGFNSALDSIKSQAAS